MAGKLTASWIDYNGERGRLTVEAASYDELTWDAGLVAIGNFIAACEAVTVGDEQVSNWSYSHVYDTALNVAAASPLAQRENKWLVRYQDTVSDKVYRIEIPTADLTLLANNSEFLDLSAGAGLAFKNAFEAYAVSPLNNSNAVEVISVQFVGRKT